MSEERKRVISWRIVTNTPDDIRLCEYDYDTKMGLAVQLHETDVIVQEVRTGVINKVVKTTGISEDDLIKRMLNGESFSYSK